ncbi:hypothetical protein BD410DRAFT_810008 [Rickenella mellea]|uniref:Uncharacterized protein n=1 Tax=Rickenella mellea TaxID=50990 RepID=A0A4Y7PFV7_9AGAM|nr:hypothetical protein BD410DRAFT_810008 [Rickenella mellea]
MTTIAELLRDAKDRISDIKKSYLAPMESKKIHGIQWKSSDLQGFKDRIKNLDKTVEDRKATASALEGVIAHSKELKTELNEEIITKILVQIEDLFPKCEAGVKKITGDHARTALTPQQRKEFPIQFKNDKAWYDGLNTSKSEYSRGDLGSLLDKLIPMWAALKPLVEAETPNKDTVLDIKPKTGRQ